MYSLHLAVCSFDIGGCASVEGAAEVLLLSSSHKQTVLTPARSRAMPAQEDADYDGCSLLILKGNAITIIRSKSVPGKVLCHVFLVTYDGNSLLPVSV